MVVFLVVWPLPDTLVTQTPELFGPILDAFVMTAVTSGRAGVKHLLRRFVLWRVGTVWYLFALVCIPAIYFFGIVLVPGGLGSFKAPAVTMSLLYPVLFLVVLVLDGPLFEEPGWRGFALPRLQERWGPLAGSVILGALWATWHATLVPVAQLCFPERRIHSLPRAGRGTLESAVCRAQRRA